MRKFIVSLVFTTYCVISVSAQQAVDSVAVKTTKTTIAQTSDSVTVEVPSTIDVGSDLKVSKNVFKPNPSKAVLYSAIFPGLGQIYNRKYWKLPIVYGGFIGLTYAVTWNGGYYNDYSDAYKAVMSDNPMSSENVDKWRPFLPYGTDIDGLTSAEVKSQYSGPFKRKKDFYRRNRDLSIIGMVALYALCMIDAYVDAQLFDFDISPDLSLRVEPTMMNQSFMKMDNRKAMGVQCSFKF